MPNRLATMGRTVGRVLVALGASSVAACAVPKDEGTPLDHGDGGLQLGDSGGDGAAFDARQDTVLDPDAACGAVTEQANIAPLHLYVLVDKSSSMSTKWKPARNGLKAFMDDPASAGIDVALNFFPRPPGGAPVCDQNAYRAPRVPFGLLPANEAALLTALDAEATDGFNTPLYPALGGAILGAIDQVKPKAGDRGAVLLVTDGEPSGPAPTCGGVNPDDPAVIAALAAAGVKQTPSISTFVIGLPGVNQTVADQISAAGGTVSAIVITDATKIEAAFQEALVKVRGEALPCDFPIPTKVAAGEVSSGLVNVQYTKGTGGVSELYQTGDCSAGGWRYDDPAKPTRIVLCPTTCAEVRGDPKGKIEILLGCKTKIR